MAQMYGSQDNADSDRHVSQQKQLLKFVFQSYGQNIHFLYQSDHKFTKGNILMNAIDQKTVCMKSVSKIFKKNDFYMQIQHKQNVLQCLCYPFFTNQYILKKQNQYFGTVKEICCRMIKPCNCFCGKIHNCSNQSVEIFDTTGHHILTIEGSLQMAFQMCQQYIKYNIYGETKQQVFGSIKQQIQFCKICPYHCSCAQMFSPVLKRVFRLQIESGKLQQILQLVFAGLIFLTKITKSYIC